MKFPHLITATFCALGALSAGAQTYTGTVQQKYCGVVQNNGVNCYGIPMTFTDDSGNTLPASVWIDQYTGESNFLVWPVDPLKLDSAQRFATFNSPVPMININPGTQQLIMTFSGLDIAGAPYSGMFNFTYTTYRANGRYGWRWYLDITGGTAEVSIGTPVGQSSSLPWPTKPHKLDALYTKNTTPRLIRIQNYNGPPQGYQCYNYTPIATYPCPPCTNNSCDTCQVMKADCEVTGEYGYYMWYYWTIQYSTSG
jgi:hypothetical protein